MEERRVLRLLRIMDRFQRQTVQGEFRLEPLHQKARLEPGLPSSRARNQRSRPSHRTLWAKENQA